MSGFRLGRESKAISDPSGDQRGDPVCGPPKCVNIPAFLPSESLTQISLYPERLDQNAIFAPSGEYCGSPCRRLEKLSREAIGGFCGFNLAVSRRHRFMFPR